MTAHRTGLGTVFVQLMDNTVTLNDVVEGSRVQRMPENVELALTSVPVLSHQLHKHCAQSFLK